MCCYGGFLTIRSLRKMQEHTLEIRTIVKHRDPFDRMFAAQSQIEKVPFISIDPAFAQFGTEVLW
jgi:PIN domain nuclease of toxin-antitoxin system